MSVSILDREFEKFDSEGRVRVNIESSSQMDFMVKLMQIQLFQTQNNFISDNNSFFLLTNDGELIKAG